MLLDHCDQTELQLEVIGIDVLSPAPRVIPIHYRLQIVSEHTSFVRRTNNYGDLQIVTPKLLLLDHCDQTELQLEVVGISGLLPDLRVILIHYRP